MIEVDNELDLDTQLRTNEKVLVLFYATWCPFCKSLVPFFDKKAANLNAISVIHVLLDDYDNPLWDNYSIEAVPTVIFFEENKVCRRLDGKSGIGLNEKQLTAWLQELKVSLLK